LDEDFSHGNYSTPKKLKPSASSKKVKGSSSKKSPKPKGGKLIYFDSVHIPKGDGSQIDKFVHSRVTSQGTIELLTKYKVCDFWAHLEFELSERRMDPCFKAGGRQKCSFQSGSLPREECRRYAVVRGRAIQPCLCSGLKKLIDTKIDRIIDEGELDNEVHYLVKWCSMAYDCCTWEPHSLVVEVFI
jgi:hypothetical protein